MCGAVIVMVRSRVLWKVRSKDHAVTAPTSTSNECRSSATPVSGTPLGASCLEPVGLLPERVESWEAADMSQIAPPEVARQYARLRLVQRLLFAGAGAGAMSAGTGVAVAFAGIEGYPDAPILGAIVGALIGLIGAGIGGAPISRRALLPGFRSKRLQLASAALAAVVAGGMWYIVTSGEGTPEQWRGAGASVAVGAPATYLLVGVALRPGRTGGRSDGEI